MPIDIMESVRKQVVTILNARLADLYDAYTQAKFAHWNVKGPEFYQLHLLFDAIAGRLADDGDTVAERCTALGGIANGTARQAVANSSLSEYPVAITSGIDHIRAMTSMMLKLATLLRVNIDEVLKLNDQVTANMLMNITESIDKDIYFLGSHLQAKE